LFDTADNALRARRSVVRLRREPDRAFVTYKGPVQPGPMKMREEQETEVADAEVLRRVLHELGLQAWFRYQKFREEFQAPGVVIALDETPIGTYLEIEGSEEGILTVTDALGCSPADFILDSYRGLFLKFAQANDVRERDMLFDPGDAASAAS
jgi:adenylate cyclase class 2